MYIACDIYLLISTYPSTHLPMYPSISIHPPHYIHLPKAGAKRNVKNVSGAACSKTSEFKRKCLTSPAAAPYRAAPVPLLLTSPRAHQR